MFQKPKGTKDIYGLNAQIFNFIKNIFFEVATDFNFHYIETPIFEEAKLFKRSSGELSEIVNKEMYIFTDKADRELALKPEATAPVVRAILENKLYANSALMQKYFYFNPAFRYEQPQKGRQRQFYQAGVEYLSISNPYTNAEVILLATELLRRLKIVDYKIKINYLGDAAIRAQYTASLKKYFSAYIDQLEELSVKRLEKNPLRILDDKKEAHKDFIKAAPKIKEFLTSEMLKSFEQFQKLLDLYEIKYEVDYSLVRGLDYYDEIVFEFIDTSQTLGAQSTILGGGRYNSLFKELGKLEQSAIGFGLGVERLMELVFPKIKQFRDFNQKQCDIYIASFNESELQANSVLALHLRQQGFRVEFGKKPEKIQQAFKNAEQLASMIIFREKDQPPTAFTVKDFTKNYREAFTLHQNNKKNQILYNELKRLKNEKN
ncbi:histidine--tRNA ligase [Candidatus Mycoplasma pogonae]